MRPPARLKIGPFDYRVVVGGSEWDAARLKENDANLIGHHSPATLTIAMQTGLVAGAQREVVIHELLHACLNVSGQPIDSDDAEETAVRGIAGPLLAALRDNPDLVAYLTAEDTR